MFALVSKFFGRQIDEGGYILLNKRQPALAER